MVPPDVRTEQRTAAEPGGRWAGTLAHGSLDTRLRHRISLARNARRPRPRALHAIQITQIIFPSTMPARGVAANSNSQQAACACVVADGRCLAQIAGSQTQVRKIAQSVPDKKDFGCNFPCDGPGRDGACDSSAVLINYGSELLNP